MLFLETRPTVKCLNQKLGNLETGYGNWSPAKRPSYRESPLNLHKRKSLLRV